MMTYLRGSSELSDSTIRTSELSSNGNSNRLNVQQQLRIATRSEPSVFTSMSSSTYYASDSEVAQGSPGRTRFILATDFGTTFSSVAFTKIQGGAIGEITSIVNWPHDPTIHGMKSLQVPTESWYPVKIYEDLASNHDNNILDEDEPHELIYDDEDEGYLWFSETKDELASQDVNMRDADQDELIRPAPVWGYGIQEKQLSPEKDITHFVPISMSKLFLDNSQNTEELRDGLVQSLKLLKLNRAINKEEDVITDYLTQLFKHAKEQLSSLYNLDDSCTVEHVLCVPNTWSPRALRIMQECIQTATRVSALGSLNNLFIVSEPEAAATFVLERTDLINAAETFMIIDAGGGTVDLTTYSVEHRFPLRLTREAVESSGGCYGSSLLNKAFRKHLEKRLETETYLEDESYTIAKRIDEIVVQFENRIKRTIDLTDKDVRTSIRITGLRQNREKGFEPHELIMRHKHYWEIFKPILHGIRRLMRQQLTRAQEAGVIIQKVILIGGFGASPTLRGFLIKALETWNNAADNGEPDIQLINPVAPETAVALGAAMRALNKEKGPERITRSSYGFLRTEPYEPDMIAAHAAPIRPRVDKVDGQKYVTNTIDWLVKKGSRLRPHETFRILSYHCFAAHRKRFICEELVYVSDVATESHYRVTHPNNANVSTIVGKLLVDMTFLRDEGYISLTYPKPGDKWLPHYKVEFELLMIIDGRNLRYEARYPPGGQIRDQGQICIAAAFNPGTE